jgi:hypothetical protein
MKTAACWGAALALLAGCAPAPPRELLPERSAPAIDHRISPDEVVAFYNGEPVTWQRVAEKMLELNLKESVDQYVRWRIVDDRKAALGIGHTPDELRRRAAAYLEQARRQLGPEGYRRQLEREGVTEEAKLAQVEKSGFLSQLLTLDKIVRFAEIVEDRIEIDRAYFAREQDAKRFHREATEKGFDAAAAGIPHSTADEGWVERESFPRTNPPQPLAQDPWILSEVSKLAPGGLTGVETSRSNLYYVIRLRAFRKGRDVVYSAVKEELLEGILKDPPVQRDYQLWMERELGRARVEYAQGAVRKER